MWSQTFPNKCFVKKSSAQMLRRKVTVVILQHLSQIISNLVFFILPIQRQHLRNSNCKVANSEQKDEGGLTKTVTNPFLPHPFFLIFVSKFSCCTIQLTKWGWLATTFHNLAWQLCWWLISQKHHKALWQWSELVPGNPGKSRWSRHYAQC